MQQTQVRRMRTINKALDYIKSVDENTSLNYNFIKNLCKNNMIHCMLIGKKYLLDLDELINYIN